MVGIGSGFLQGGITGDHFAGDQIFADAEVRKRALSLRAPEFVSRNIYFAEAVCFLANFRHFVFSFVYSSAWWPSLSIPVRVTGALIRSATGNLLPAGCSRY